MRQSLATFCRANSFFKIADFHGNRVSIPPFSATRARSRSANVQSPELNGKRHSASSKCRPRQHRVPIHLSNAHRITWNLRTLPRWRRHSKLHQGKSRLFLRGGGCSRIDFVWITTTMRVARANKRQEKLQGIYENYKKMGSMIWRFDWSVTREKQRISISRFTEWRCSRPV